MRIQLLNLFIFTALVCGCPEKQQDSDIGCQKDSCSPPEESYTVRHLISVYTPDDYDESDLLRFAELGIDMHNWVEQTGGEKMTPYLKNDGTFDLTDTQKNFIKQLYAKGQRRIWVGINYSHIEQIKDTDLYSTLSKALTPFVELIKTEKLEGATVGLYTGSKECEMGLWQDESMIKPLFKCIDPNNYQLCDDSISNCTTCGNIQFNKIKEMREKTKTAMGNDWIYVTWVYTGLKTGRNFEGCGDFSSLSLTSSDEQNLFIYNSGLISPDKVILKSEMIYHGYPNQLFPGDPQYNETSSNEWFTKWASYKKFAPTDRNLDIDGHPYFITTGEKGNKQLTDQGKKFFNIQ